MAERTKLLLEYCVEYGKRGANPQRVPRASRHVVASKVADTNLALFWRRAKRKPFRLTVRKDD
jgi:hypothetical protein